MRRMACGLWTVEERFKGWRRLLTVRPGVGTLWGVGGRDEHGARQQRQRSSRQRRFVGEKYHYITTAIKLLPLHRSRDRGDERHMQMETRRLVVGRGENRNRQQEPERNAEGRPGGWKAASVPQGKANTKHTCKNVRLFSAQGSSAKAGQMNRRRTSGTVAHLGKIWRICCYRAC